MKDNIKGLIEYSERIPHFHKDFPIILFWSHRSGCTSLRRKGHQTKYKTREF